MTRYSFKDSKGFLIVDNKIYQTFIAEVVKLTNNEEKEVKKLFAWIRGGEPLEGVEATSYIKQYKQSLIL